MKISDLTHNTIKKLNSRLYSWDFGLQTLLSDIGTDPVCYITGSKIDLEETSSYHLDHKIPKCRGGDNSLDNCGLVLSDVNFAKHKMSLEDFVEMCKTVVEGNGYEVKKKAN